MTDISHSTGRYRHAADGKRPLVFGERRFSVILATAYDAGIVGTERNGIALVDDNYGQVVFDELLRGQSPAAQRKAFEAISEIKDWKAFTALVRGNERYRFGMPDMDEPEPAKLDEAAVLGTAMRTGQKPPPGPSILTPAQVDANANPETPYKFPHASRGEMIVFLAGHAKHRPDYHGNGYLAWNIKLYDADWSGRAPGMDPDPAYDALWDKYAKANAEHLYQQACEDGLSSYLDGSASSYPGDDAGDYKFEVGGRSGGWLHLTEYNDVKLGFDSESELIEKLCDLSDNHLAQLYGAVVCFDKDIDPKKEVAFQLACAREQVETEWKSDPDAAEAVARKLGMTDWAAPRASAPAA